MQPEVYRVRFFGGFLNLYLIDTSDGVIVVDTGFSQASVSAIGRRLKQLGKSLTDIKHILITHAHPDHTGGLAALQQKASNSATYAHRLEAFAIQGEQSVQLPPQHKLRGLARLMRPLLSDSAGPFAQVHVKLHGDDALDRVLPGLQALHLRGHSVGHTGYWWAERGILFGGDIMMHLPWGLTMPPAAASPDWEAAKQAIIRVSELPVETLYLGHGAPIMKNASRLIAQMAERVRG